MSNADEWIVGVVSDTHVPDRAAGLHPDLLPGLQQARVGLILHAGDICSPRVLTELEQVAPVIAVRGNRDWAFIGKLPWRQDLEIGRLKLSLMHGMGNWGKYLLFKIKYAASGYALENYLPMMQKAAPEADVIVFGHTHRPEVVRSGGQLFFNPGSAGPVQKRGWQPSFGLLRVQSGGLVQAEIRKLG